MPQGLDITRMRDGALKMHYELTLDLLERLEQEGDYALVQEAGGDLDEMEGEAEYRGINLPGVYAVYSETVSAPPIESFDLVYLDGEEADPDLVEKAWALADQAQVRPSRIEEAWLGLVDNGNLAAVLFLGVIGGRATFSVVVDEPYKGKGFGKKLVDTAIEEAEDFWGAKEIAAQSINPLMAEMLLRRGFTDEGRDYFTLQLENGGTVGDVTLPYGHRSACNPPGDFMEYPANPGPFFRKEPYNLILRGSIMVLSCAAELLPRTLNVDFDSMYFDHYEVEPPNNITAESIRNDVFLLIDLVDSSLRSGISPLHQYLHKDNTVFLLYMIRGAVRRLSLILRAISSTFFDDPSIRPMPNDPDNDLSYIREILSAATEVGRVTLSRSIDPNKAATVEIVLNGASRGEILYKRRVPQRDIRETEEFQHYWRIFQGAHTYRERGEPVDIERFLPEGVSLEDEFPFSQLIESFLPADLDTTWETFYSDLAQLPYDETVERTRDGSLVRLYVGLELAGYLRIHLEGPEDDPDMAIREAIHDEMLPQVLEIANGEEFDGSDQTDSTLEIEKLEPVSAYGSLYFVRISISVWFEREFYEDDYPY